MKLMNFDLAQMRKTLSLAIGAMRPDGDICVSWYVAQNDFGVMNAHEIKDQTRIWVNQRVVCLEKNFRDVDCNGKTGYLFTIQPQNLKDCAMTNCPLGLAVGFMVTGFCYITPFKHIRDEVFAAINAPNKPPQVDIRVIDKGGIVFHPPKHHIKVLTREDIMANMKAHEERKKSQAYLQARKAEAEAKEAARLAAQRRADMEAEALLAELEAEAAAAQKKKEKKAAKKAKKHEVMDPVARLEPEEPADPVARLEPEEPADPVARLEGEDSYDPVARL